MHDVVHAGPLQIRVAGRTITLDFKLQTCHAIDCVTSLFSDIAFRKSCGPIYSAFRWFESELKCLFYMFYLLHFDHRSLHESFPEHCLDNLSITVS